MRTAGSVALTNCETPRHEIARACGVSLATVSYWATGKKRPTPAKRLLLEQHFGIKKEQWDRITSTGPAAAPIRVQPRAERAARRALRLMHSATEELAEFVRLQSQKAHK